MSIYRDCKWCYGAGINNQECNQCEPERQKAIKEYEGYGPQPIFTAKLDSPSDMESLRRIAGKESLEDAFGPDGGGIQDIEAKAAIESMLQILRKEK